MSYEDRTIIADLSASDTYTDWLKIRGASRQLFTIKASGNFVGTLTVQMRDPEDLVAIDVAPEAGVITGPGIYNGMIAAGIDVRVGFKAGDYTSGTAKCRINQAGNS